MDIETPHTSSDMTAPQCVSARPPPIFVYGVKNYSAFSKFLHENNVTDCTRTTQTVEQYHQLHAVLRPECAEAKCADTLGALKLHFYQLKSDRAFVVYLWGLPSTLNIDEIKSALLEKMFVPRRVTNVPKKVDGKHIPRPLFRVELEPNSLNLEIYNLNNILQVRIKVEPFKPRAHTTVSHQIPIVSLY